MVVRIPSGKTLKPLKERCRRPEAYQLFQIRNICVCCQHITELHGYGLFVRVEIGRQDTGGDQFFLQGLYRFEQAHRGTCPTLYRSTSPEEADCTCDKNDGIDQKKYIY